MFNDIYIILSLVYKKQQSFVEHHVVWRRPPHGRRGSAPAVYQCIVFIL